MRSAVVVGEESGGGRRGSDGPNRMEVTCWSAADRRRGTGAALLLWPKRRRALQRVVSLGGIGAIASRRPEAASAGRADRGGAAGRLRRISEGRTNNLVVQRGGPCKKKMSGARETGWNPTGM